jgi:tetratricopeptide (TPR) repeat protein
MTGQQKPAPQTQAPAQPAAPKGPTPKSPEEGAAVQALTQSITPDAAIAAADDFIAKYPSSDFKALAYLVKAQSLQQKKDYANMVVAGESALESNPDDGTKVQALLLLARSIASKAKENDFDLQEELAKAEKYANSALDMVKTMPKPNPALSDAQWDAAKGDLAGQAHEALGMDQMARKNYPKAAAEFQSAIDAGDSDPTVVLRLALAYDRAGKYDDALAACDKLLAIPTLGPGLKATTERERAHLQKMKNPAAAAAPAPSPTAAPLPTAKP